VVEVAEPTTEKKSFVCPQCYKFGCIFYAVFKRQKTRIVIRSLGTRILRFNRETKLTKTVQKLF